ncbi:MAG TPA: septum formation inhibitor Maf [Candidatus Mediterraneibacter vanvlietii]|nr:septum formation inhibitor Maf [Candidatus Mediterraneibacter vanvlietii]
MKKIILGSASPRRRELLSQIGVSFEVRTSGREEIYHSAIPEEIVRELALMKAENVAGDLTDEQNEAPKDTIVIGADTIVVLDGKILGKPVDEKDAADMIGALQGRSHEVYTGVAILDYDAQGEKNVSVHAVGTKVYVNPMDEAEISAYIDTGEPMDKAGAYGIQGRFAAYIDRIEGDYYNVVGLPVSYVYQALKRIGAF